MKLDATMMINRELSWLEFNQRVLDEGNDPRVPLLERLKFLAITDSNLKEFFMVRVGSLQGLAKANIRTKDDSGMTAAQQLKAIRQRVADMLQEQQRLFKHLEGGLQENGIVRLKPEELKSSQQQFLDSYFEEELQPIITPSLIDPRGIFPNLKQESLYLAVRLKGEKRNQSKMAFLPIGSSLERFIQVPGGRGYTYCLLEDAVRRSVNRFFPGKVINECVVFKITRNADMSVREDSAYDLLSEMRSILVSREKSHTVRLEIEGAVSRGLLKTLCGRLNIGTDRVYQIPGPLALADFMDLAFLRGFEQLCYENWTPQVTPGIEPTENIFATMKKRDFVLNHPYDSYEPVIRLVEEAADDPNVLAIKQVLYRTAKNSRIIDSLERAARNGKYVTALVELKARFDEGRNIGRARQLEDAGVQVVYGVKGLKTHSKICIVVRREPEGLVRYCHYGTGNYNESTAKLYSDISYFTCNPELGRDGSAFFNAVCGFSEPVNYARLSMAPISMKKKIINLIDGEAEQCKQGRKGQILAKMNSLVDRDVIKALYKASNAGVKIKLNVRGICCLKPGVKGLSENIEVTSIIDRYLEHSRIYCFHHGGDNLTYISSADWMPRNLERRVELLVPVDQPDCRDELLRIMDVYFKDTAKGCRLLADNTFEKKPTKSKKSVVRSQEVLYNRACKVLEIARQKKATQLEPHMPGDRPLN